MDAMASLHLVSSRPDDAELKFPPLSSAGLATAQVRWPGYQPLSAIVRPWSRDHTRVSEFVHIQVPDVFLRLDPPQIYLAHVKGDSDGYVPILPILAQELQTGGFCITPQKGALRLSIVRQGRMLCELLHESRHIDGLGPPGELEPAMQVHMAPGGQRDPFECLRAGGITAGQSLR